MTVVSQESSTKNRKKNPVKKADEKEKKSPKPKSPQYVLSITLRTNPRDESILNQKYEAHGKLLNATLNTVLGRVDQMRRDSRWREVRLLKDGSPEKKQAYARLHQEYGVGSFASIDVAFKHWQASKWMSSVIGGKIALSTGQEAWDSVAAWLYQTRPNTGRPRFKPSKESSILHGSGNKQNLFLATKTEKSTGMSRAYVRVGCSVKRKKLLLELPKEWQPGTLNWESKLASQLQDEKIKRVSLKRETVRGRTRFTVLIAIEGLPYRNPEYLEQTKQVHGKHVGLDVGPSSLAVVGESESMRLNLFSDEVARAHKKEALKVRRYQRFLDRSCRAMNPDTYDAKGRNIKGKRKTNKSKKSQRVQALLNEAQRKQGIHKRENHTLIARSITSSMGTSMSSELNSYSGWQKSFYGRRMLETAPAMLMKRVHDEGKLLHRTHEQIHTYSPCAPGNKESVKSLSTSNGSYEFPTSENCAPSQHCLCGSKAKKELSNRYHSCKECGLGLPNSNTALPVTDTSHRLDRDLMSALLARFISENATHLPDKQNLLLSDGPYAQHAREGGLRAKVIALTSASTPVVTPSLLLSRMREQERNHSITLIPASSPVSPNPSNSLVVTKITTQTPGEHETPQSVMQRKENQEENRIALNEQASLIVSPSSSLTRARSSRQASSMSQMEPRKATE